MAVKLKREGKKSIEVADIVGHSKRQINRWWAKAKLPGPMKLTYKKGRGQKSKLTAGDKAQITALMKGKVGRSHRKVSKLLNNSDRQRGFTVSPSTIVRYVRKLPWGKKSFMVKHYPLLKAEQKAKRKDVCHQWIRDKIW